MVEGFWILQIETPQFTSGGVVVFTKGKIFGGDNGFTWVGTYAGDDRLIKGRVNVHNFDPDIQSILVKALYDGEQSNVGGWPPQLVQFTSCRAFA